MVFDEVDSNYFKDAIMKSILVELPRDIEEMIIQKEFGNDYFGNLVIENNVILEKVVVKKNALMNLKLLKICNCEKLKSIEFKRDSCTNVKNVTIESI